MTSSEEESRKSRKLRRVTVVVLCVLVVLGAVPLVAMLTTDSSPPPSAGDAEREDGRGSETAREEPPAPDTGPTSADGRTEAEVESSCDGVVIAPGDDLQAAVDAEPTHTTFCIKAGVHRLQQVVPKDGQRFIGEGEGTILSGAIVLAAEDAKRDDSGLWYWEDQTQQSDPHGNLSGAWKVRKQREGNRYNEELFVTASSDLGDPPTRYQRVLNRNQVKEGTWFLDRSADRIYLSEDPSTLGLIETSVAAAFLTAGDGRVTDVAVENLVVEKYATPAQKPALGNDGAHNWEIRYVTVRYNHGSGAELGAGTLMEYSKIHDMGQLGLQGGGNAQERPTLLRHTEVHHNNQLFFDSGWEAGGTKFTRVFGRGMIVEHSWFHDNYGSGLWFDIDNHDVVIRSNRFEGNERFGAFFEVSRDADIYWNVFAGNRPGPEEERFQGAGLFISNSANVEVYENLFTDNENGIVVKEDINASRGQEDTYRDGIPETQNVVVRDNDVEMTRGFTGLHVEGARGDQWGPDRVDFSGNVYRLDDEGAERFYWQGNTLYTFATWQQRGNDADGSVLTVGSDAAASLPDDAAAFHKVSYGAAATRQAAAQRDAHPA